MRALDAILPRVTRRADLVHAWDAAPMRDRMDLAEAYFGAGGDFGFNGFTTFSVGGQTYTVPIQTTLPGQKAETIANSFEGYVLGGLQGNVVVFGLIATRLRIFSEVRFQYQRFNGGRPGDLWGDQSLAVLEKPWSGGVTGDLLALMLLHADLAGNCYITKIGSQLVVMRPDWVDIVLGDRGFTDSTGREGAVGMEKIGFAYYHGGKQNGKPPMFFLADEVAQFSPSPDPLAWYRGMSWLTPAIREVRTDMAATNTKLAYFENSMTPNLAVSLKEISDPEQFQAFVDKMDERHSGTSNAFKTLYLGAGADVTVIGKDFREMDLAAITGISETRLAQAAGVPPVVAGISEGLKGSSLNAGNFSQARRQFADSTLSPLWRNAAGSLEMIVTPPPGSRLWYDARDVPFLREDQKDEADIRVAEAQAIRELFIAGFEPDSIIKAVLAKDWSLLKHTGTYSIQVQTPGTTSTRLPSTIDEPPIGTETTSTQTEQVAATPAPPAKSLVPVGGSNGNGSNLSNGNGRGRRSTDVGKDR